MTKRRKTRRGLTLVEVLAASLILAASLAALSHLHSAAFRTATRSEVEALGLAICESTLEEVVAGNTQIELGRRIAHPDRAEWDILVRREAGPIAGSHWWSVEVYRSHANANTLTPVAQLQTLVRDSEGTRR